MKQKFTQTLASLLVACVLLFTNNAKSQCTSAPNISYSGVNTTYTTGTAITSLIPNNTGGTPNASTNKVVSTTTFGSGFSGPTGVAVDAAGAVYVADIGNSAVYKIVGNTVTTLGSGFNLPTSVAVDAAGAVYVADAGNSTVKKIVGSTVTTLGSGFYQPYGVAVDAAGAVYVADAGNSTIKKIVGSTVTTLGSGFYQPNGVAVDAAGIVYVADWGNGAVKKIVGNTVTTLGSGFANPTSVALDASGAVYVADNGHNAVKKIVGNTVTTLGSGFNYLFGLAVDAAGAVYVADYGNSNVKKMVFANYAIRPALPVGLRINDTTGIISGTPTVVTPSTTYAIITQNNCGYDTTHITFSTCTVTASTFTQTACGSYTWVAKHNTVYTASNTIDTIKLANFHGCDSIVTLNLTINNLPNISYASVSASYPIGTAITSLTPSNIGGTPTASSNKTISTTTLGSGFSYPYGVAVDAAGAVYVADYGNSAVYKIVGNTLTTLGSGFSGPTGVAVDAAGAVYVADIGNSAVYKIVGNTVTTLGSGFNLPTSVAVDAAGAVYVADNGNNEVEKIVGNTVTTLGSGFNGPNCVALDAAGAVYVAEFNNYAVKKIVGNTVTTVGSGFTNPVGIAVDAAGAVYVADYGNSAVKKIVGNTVTILGSGFVSPYGVAVDAAGAVYVTDLYNNTVQKMVFATYNISPALPTGLTMNYTSGVISGTPTVATPSTTYAIITQNGCGNDTAHITFATCTATAFTFTQTACGSYTWVAKHNTVYTSSNNTDTIKLVNATGCDSIVTLNLTIKQPTSSTFTVSACGSYKWAAKHNTVYTSSNTTDTIKLVNAGGCDSIITLHLTINSATHNSMTIATIGNYTWYGTAYTHNGTYTHSYNNSNGCASVDTLKLTILPSSGLGTQCGTTLTSTSQTIGAAYVNGATHYRFRIVNGSQVDSITTVGRFIIYKLIPNYQYSTTYSISICYEYNGSYKAYGSACNITTPAAPTTAIQSSQCGISLSALNTQINANYMPGATHYRFKIVHGSQTDSITTVGRYFNFTQVPNYQYNTTYSVSVSYEFHGTYQPYGSVCHITTPAGPTTQVQSSQCGVTLAINNQTLGANAIVGATHYRFKIVNSTQVDSITAVGRFFNFTLIPHYYYATTYNISVSYEFHGTYQPYGSICQVSTPSIYRLKASLGEETTNTTTEDATSTIDMNLYPNPTTNSFTIETNCINCGKMKIEVMNLQGQLMYETEMDNSEGRMLIMPNLEAGMYFVKVTSADKKYQQTKSIVISK